MIKYNFLTSICAFAVKLLLSGSDLIPRCWQQIKKFKLTDFNLTGFFSYRTINKFAIKRGCY